MQSQNKTAHNAKKTNKKKVNIQPKRKNKEVNGKRKTKLKLPKKQKQNDKNLINIKNKILLN